MDDYARVSAAQKAATLKHKRPPTLTGAHTPRSVVSVASTRTRAELAAVKLRLEQAEANAAAERQRDEQTEALAADAQNYVYPASAQVPAEQQLRLEAQSQASRLSGQLQALATDVANERADLQSQAQAHSDEAAKHISLAQATQQLHMLSIWELRLSSGVLNKSQRSNDRPTWTWSGRPRPLPQRTSGRSPKWPSACSRCGLLCSSYRQLDSRISLSSGKKPSKRLHENMQLASRCWRMFSRQR